jgi:hypothetical protein
MSLTETAPPFEKKHTAANSKLLIYRMSQFLDTTKKLPDHDSLPVRKFYMLFSNSRLKGSHLSF